VADVKVIIKSAYSWTAILLKTVYLKTVIF